MKERTLKFLVVVLLLYLMLAYISKTDLEKTQEISTTLTKDIAVNIFSIYAAPLQIVALILVAAMLGGVFLAKEDK